MFILDFPDEGSMDNTIAYAKNLTACIFSVWTHYPGTPVFKEFENKIIVKEFESYDQYNLIYKHNTLTPKLSENI